MQWQRRRKLGTGHGCVARQRRFALHPILRCGRHDIDWAAYRTLVRYCVGDLGHHMLWCTSGLSEFWGLTLDERKRLLEVAVAEPRPGDWRRQRLSPDADEGGARRRGRAELLALHRRSHRHRAGHVQLTVVPDLQIWECDKTVCRAGWLPDGIVCPAQLGTAGYLFETPQRRVFTEYWNLIWDGKLIEAMDYAKVSGARPVRPRHRLLVHLLPRACGLLHALGRGVQVRRVGARHAHRRSSPFTPPQAVLPAAAKVQIRDAYQRF